MPTRLVNVVIDAAGPARLRASWGRALGWEITGESADEVDLEPPDCVGLPLGFVPVSDPKRGKNRVRLDLRSGSAAERAARVDRLSLLGAKPADIGEGSGEGRCRGRSSRTPRPTSSACCRRVVERGS